jgi:hypothetical protein
MLIKAYIFFNSLQDSRIISLVGSVNDLGTVISFLDKLTSTSAACIPISADGNDTVVSGGLIKGEKSLLLKPITDIDLGTSSPRSRNAVIAPRAK